MGGACAGPVAPQPQPAIRGREATIYLGALSPELLAGGRPVSEEYADLLVVRVLHAVEEIKAGCAIWPERSKYADRRDGLSASAAAVATAYGPPPENPQTAIRLIPRSFAMASTSALQSAITRPGIGVDPPYAGRS